MMSVRCDYCGVHSERLREVSTCEQCGAPSAHFERSGVKYLAHWIPVNRLEETSEALSGYINSRMIRELDTILT